MSDHPLDQYKKDSVDRVSAYKNEAELQTAKTEFFKQIGIGKANYVYNFFWLGVPVIQIPQDIQAMQEMIWQVKPDLIIDTGVAWGGSAIFCASMLAILEACNEIDDGLVVGIDIDIRSHNKQNIRQHPLSKKIQLLEGSSVDKQIVEKVYKLAENKKRVMCFLDSNHTHNHVLEELRSYSPLVTKGSYIMVGDTTIEGAPESMVSERPWGNGNNPRTAVWQFLKENTDFQLDHYIEDKLVLTGSPDGFLKRVSVSTG